VSIASMCVPSGDHVFTSSAFKVVRREAVYWQRLFLISSAVLVLLI
jgi:hypothetical protein